MGKEKDLIEHMNIWKTSKEAKDYFDGVTEVARLGIENTFWETFGACMEQDPGQHPLAIMLRVLESFHKSEGERLQRLDFRAQECFDDYEQDAKQQIYAGFADSSFKLGVVALATWAMAEFYKKERV